MYAHRSRLELLIESHSPAQVFEVLTLTTLTAATNDYPPGNAPLRLQIHYRQRAGAPSRLLQQYACLSFAPIVVTAEQSKRYWRGIITAVRWEYTEQDAVLGIQLESLLYPLQQKYSKRVYKHRAISDILQDILATQSVFSHHFQLTTASQAPYHVQYDQSDYAFFYEVLKHYGFFHYFEHHQHHSRLIVCDQFLTDSRPIPTLSLIPSQDMLNREFALLELHRHEQVLSNSVSLHNDDHGDPAARQHYQLTSQASTPGIGHQQLMDSGFANCQHAQHHLSTYLQQLDMHRLTYHAVTNCHDLEVGRLIHIAQPPLGNLRIINLAHFADQQAGQHFTAENPRSRYRYFNRLTLIAAQQPYSCTEPDNAHYSLLPATIYAPATATSAVDKQGHYAIHLASMTDQPAIEGVRLLQASGGDNYGIHFPLPAATPVIVGCLNGQLSQPVIIGTAAEQLHSEKIADNWLSSRHNHYFSSQNSSNSSQLMLMTASRQQSLRFCRKNGVALRNEQGQLTIAAATTQHYSSQRHITYQSSQTLALTAERITFDAGKQGFAVTAGQSIIQQSAQTTQVNAKNITIHYQAAATITAAGEVSWQITQGDCHLQARDGKLSLTSQQGLNLRSITGRLILQCGPARLELNPDGNIHLSGQQINLIGDQQLAESLLCQLHC